MNYDPKNKKQDPTLKTVHGYDAPETDATRAGGDDALSASPDDSRLDEMVIVNEQRGEKITNAPSPATDSGIVNGSDEDIIDEHR